MTTPKEHEVTQGGNCPFWDGEFGCCNLDGSNHGQRVCNQPYEGPPDWCPLREGPITVRLRK